MEMSERDDIVLKNVNDTAIHKSKYLDAHARTHAHIVQTKGHKAHCYECVYQFMNK